MGRRQEAPRVRHLHETPEMIAMRKTRRARPTRKQDARPSQGPHPPVMYDFELQQFMCRGCSAIASARLPGDPLRASALITLEWVAKAAAFANLHHHCPRQCRAPSPQIAGLGCVRPAGHEGFHDDGVGGAWPMGGEQSDPH